MPGELEILKKEAAAKGFVRVLVTLDDQVSIAAIRDDLARVRSAMDQKAAALLAELGSNALSAGFWTNGIGQVGVYVDAGGLRILERTSNVSAFMPDVTSGLRHSARDGDGSLDEIDAQLNATGFAQVEIVLNSDAEFDIKRDGTTVTRSSAQTSAAVADRVRRLMADPMSRHLQNIDLLPTRGPAPQAKLKALIGREGFIWLKESADVRALHAIGFADRRPARWAPETLLAARKTGEAEVVITLRGGESYSPRSGSMSEAAWKAQGDAHRRVFDEIIAAAGGGAATTASASTYDSLGVINVRLPHEVLQQLFSAKDSRILSVNLNRPVAQSLLINSTNLMGMPGTWNAGYRAAGQFIVVIDSGIRRDHQLFSTSGVSRVVFEACFGSRLNSPATQEDYHSICPGSDALGDSPLGFAGAGQPWSDLATCTALETQQDASRRHDCAHGTHVAGIASGRSSTQVSPAGLQGVAPDASLVAVQVFSYDRTNLKSAAFNADLLAALNAVLSAAGSATGSPLVVNMSIGGAAATADCPAANPELTAAVANLTSRGIPVVVATGNSSNKNGIAFPACIPNTIKVSSVGNDSTGTTLAGFANIGNPQRFTGPILLAPGGSATTSVTSADRASTTATKALRGTSQAAPHVAGLYAAIKAAVPTISVADATGWIVSSASIPVTYNLPAPVGTQTYRRIRLPAL